MPPKQKAIRSHRCRSFSIRENRDKAIFRAPFDGTVATLPVGVGDLVSPGALVVSLVNTDGYQISAYISDDQRMNISEGSKATIENQVNGEVFRIAPSIDPITKKVEVIINITDEDPPLTVGQFAEVKILPDEFSNGSGGYVLPLSAIKVTPQMSYVYQVNSDNKLEQHEVEQGRVIGDSVELIKGLTDNMLVVESTRGLKAEQEVEVVN